MLLAPLVLAFALGAAFGSGDNFTIGPIETIVANLDSGSQSSEPNPTDLDAGAMLAGFLAGSDLDDLLDVSSAESAAAARAAVDRGDAAVAVVIPDDFSEAITADAGGQPELGSRVLIYSDPTLETGPAIVTTVVNSVVDGLNGARAAYLTSLQLGAAAGLSDTERLAAASQRAAAAYAAAARSEPPIRVDGRDPNSGDESAAPNVASQVLVGMMIFFMLFGAATPARNIIDEHRDGTLTRLFTTPTPRNRILAGKYIGVFAVVLLQSVIILLVGRLLMGARWGAIGPVAVLTVCGALVAASLGLFTVSFAKTPAQAGAVSAAIFVFLGLAGGNFVGSVDIGGAFALIRRFTPNGWLLEGWGHLLFGGSWSSIALPVAVVVGFAAVFFALATFFFRRRYA